MKVALPTRNNQIDSHFGHCEYFSIATIENNQIVSIETLSSPEGCGCKSDIAPTLAKNGVRILLGGNMGEGAKNVLQANGIKVIRGCSGSIHEVLQDFINNKLTDNLISCDHHDCHHE